MLLFYFRLIPALEATQTGGRIGQNESRRFPYTVAPPGRSFLMAIPFD